MQYSKRANKALKPKPREIPWIRERVLRYRTWIIHVYILCIKCQIRERKNESRKANSMQMGREQHMRAYLDDDKYYIYAVGLLPMGITGCHLKYLRRLPYQRDSPLATPYATTHDTVASRPAMSLSICPLFEDFQSTKSTINCQDWHKGPSTQRRSAARCQVRVLCGAVKNALARWPQ